MKDEEFDRKLQEALANALPEEFGEAKERKTDSTRRPVLPNGRKSPQPQGKKKALILCAIIGVLLLLLGCGLGFWLHAKNNAKTLTMSLDADAGIQLTLDSAQKVVSTTVKGENTQALAQLQLEGREPHEALALIIDTMVQLEMLTPQQSSVLISVQGEGQSAEQLCNTLAADADELIRQQGLEGAVLSQTFSTIRDLQVLSDRHGLTQGKARLIQEMTKAQEGLSFEELAGLTVNELCLIAISGEQSPEGITFLGAASELAYVGRDHAIQSALVYAKTSADQVSNLKEGFTCKDNALAYRVTFLLDGIGYTTLVDPFSGAILSQQKNDTPTPEPTPDPEPNDSSSASNQSSSGSELPPVDSQGHIGTEKAKQIAIEHAQAKIDEVTNMRVELDTEGGLARYELTFSVGSIEYEYEINAKTGTVLKYEWAKKGPSQSTVENSGSDSYIGSEQAKKIALSSVGVAESAAEKWSVEFSIEPGGARYKVEFEADGTEYKIEVDASTGTILTE